MMIFSCDFKVKCISQSYFNKLQLSLYIHVNLENIIYCITNM